MYKKIVLSFFIITLSLLVGCSGVSERQVEQIVTQLEEKYNEKFVATHLGGRYGTATNDTVTAVIHPEGNENVTFYAKMTKDGEAIGDGYTPRLISEQFNTLLKEELASAGIEIEVFTLPMKVKTNSNEETDTTLTIENYVKKYEPGFFSAQAIVKDTGDVTGEDFEKALLKAYETGLETIYQIQARVMPEEEFDKAREEFVKLPLVNATWFYDYHVVEKIEAVADPNGYNFRYAEGHPAYGDGS